MPRLTVAAQLARALDALRARRQKLVDEIAEIDQLAAASGLNLQAGPRRRGRPRRTEFAIAPVKAGRRRKRRRMAQTGEVFVIEVIRKAGELTTAEINKAWKESGRGGLANNTLTRLTKSKVLKKSKLAEGRGSNYALGSAAPAGE